jgi:hypothetical protein
MSGGALGQSLLGRSTWLARVPLAAALGQVAQLLEHGRQGLTIQARAVLVVQCRGWINAQLAGGDYALLGQRQEEQQPLLVADPTNDDTDLDEGEWVI